MNQHQQKDGPNTPPPNPRKDLDRLLKLFAVYRDYMKVEHDLQNHRSTWHLLMQGFLFTALAAIGAWQFLPQLKTERELLPKILISAGITIAVCTGISIEAAAAALRSLENRWKKRMKPKFDEDTFELIPEISGGGSGGAPFFGQIAPRFIPFVALIAWFSVWWMYRQDKKASINPPPIAAKSAQLDRAAARFVNVTSGGHDIALDTVTGAYCKTWNWQPTSSKDKKNPIYALPTCNNILQSEQPPETSASQ